MSYPVYKDITSKRNNPFDHVREVEHYSWFSIIIKNIENGYYSMPCKPTICVEDDACFFLQQLWFLTVFRQDVHEKCCCIVLEIEGAQTTRYKACQDLIMDDI